MTKLKELGITHIVNACSSDFLYEEVSILLDWSSIGIRHTHVHIKDEDTSDLLSILPYTTSFIMCGLQEGGVLVYWWESLLVGYF